MAEDTGFRRNNGLMFTTALALVASLLSVASTADLAVDLNAKGGVVGLIPSARYDVTIANLGPDPITSATVVVELEYRPVFGTASPCVLDIAGKTLTCTFGPLTAGASATMGMHIYLGNVSDRPTVIDATATRTASSPSDPNAANDTDTAPCWYYPLPPQQQWPPPVSC